MIEALLQNILGTDLTSGECDNVTDSTGAKMKLWHQRFPQSGTVKGLVYHIIDTSPTYHKKGGETEDAITVQIDIYHEKDVEVRTVAGKIRALLSGWAGTYDSQRWNYTTLQSEAGGINDELRTPNRIQTYIFKKAL